MNSLQFNHAGLGNFPGHNQTSSPILITVTSVMAHDVINSIEHKVQKIYNSINNFRKVAIIMQKPTHLIFIVNPTWTEKGEADRCGRIKLE